jgi:putative ABC transport system permease protein
MSVAGSGQWALAARLARRELRGGLKGFRVFLACLTLGVAAIAGVGSLSSAVTSALRADAGRLLGGDIDIRLIHRPADPDQRAYFRAAGEFSEITEIRAMARRGGDGPVRRTLVEVKGVDAAYPLIGTFATKPQVRLSDALAKHGETWGTVVDRNLMTKLGLGIGDEMTIGDARFRIEAEIVLEPDRVATVVSFGPHVVVHSDAIEATGLVQPGSQIHYHYRLKLPPRTNVKAWITRTSETFPNAGWRIRDTDGAAPGLNRFIVRMTLFLTFVGLTTLLVGGIGVTNAVTSYLDGKTRTIATLKCLGASAGLVFKTYLLQILGLAGVGVAIGLAIGGAVPWLASGILSEQLPVKIQGGIHAAPLAVAAVFGLATALTFTVWPLARARDIPAAHLFRDSVDHDRVFPRGLYLAAVGGGAALLIALTMLFAGDPWFAMWFVLGAGASLVVLRGAAWAMTRLAARIKRIPNPEWRLAIANLHRPGAATASVVVSLGLGMGVLVAIALIEGNLNNQIKERLPDMAPAFFFIDIQPDQAAAFDHAVTGVPGAGEYKRVASLRGRIVKIDGVPVEQVDIASDSQWAVRGDRALTYLAEPSEESQIIAGNWWPTDYRGEPLISLDADLARGFGVGLGDTLTLNILGREIEGKITSLRAIDWRTLRFDFAVIFSPGVLDAAPQTHIAAMRAPETAEDAIEAAVNQGFDNVSVIRVREALQAAADLLAGIGIGVRATAAVTLSAGILVLAGAVAAGRRRRIVDAVVFKVLGATRAMVLRAFVVEYGILGLATGLIAAVIGTATAWAVIVWLMEAIWIFIPGSVAWVVALSITVTMVFGFAGTWRALGQKAAPILRNE